MLATSFAPIGSVPRASLVRLFDEEALMWVRDLKWSFEPTRRRLEASLQDGTLSGLVASDDQGVYAYATYSLDADHGVVGSFFAAKRSRAPGIEGALVREVLRRLRDQSPRVIDCQTLFSSEPGLKEPFEEEGFESATRIYMTLDRDSGLKVRVAAAKTGSKPTHRADLRPLARLVHQAHLETRSLDASSSFDTLDSCEKILRQIVLDNACGPFDSLGSRRVEASGEVLAACLLTWPLPGVAHVSEVATAPTHRRQGLARRCLTETLAYAFEGGGALTATLSVTETNHAARALYESFGFVPRLRYKSHVLRERAP